jgi:cytidyltransferase-like protein
MFCSNIFNKKIEFVYGPCGIGLQVQEDVAEGEILWSRIGDDKSLFTREQLCQMIKDKPNIAQQIIDFSCQSGEDLFTLPTACLTGEKIDPRQYINHSCDPNCGYRTDTEGKTYTVALRAIFKGEELTKDYATLETEASFTYGLECKCGTKKCSGTWKFDLYRRDDPHATKMLGFSKPELIKKAESMRTEFWHSTTSYLKRIPSNRPIKERELVLCALRDIRKGDDVARFINGKIKFVHLNSEEANCVFEKGRLIANRDIPAGVDISLATVINVYCEGVFDLMHFGHMNHIRNSKEYGTRLLVGVVSDEVVETYKRKPIMSMEERIAAVKAFGLADEVIENAPVFMTQAFLDKWDIHVVCISPEYSAEDHPFYQIPRKLGIVQVMTRTPGISTTELIDRIKKF